MKPDRAQVDERALAERFCREGDEAAFRALYRQHTPVLFRIACRMVSDTDRAADIVQDTWLRASCGLSSFRWQSGLRTWLVGIAINRSREAVRQKAREAPAQQEPPEPRAPTSDMARQIDLERAIGELPEGYREVFLLHDVEGYTHEEIAQALAIEPATSRSQLARARAAMRLRLDQRMDEA